MSDLFGFDGDESMEAGLGNAVSDARHVRNDTRLKMRQQWQKDKDAYFNCLRVKTRNPQIGCVKPKRSAYMAMRGLGASPAEISNVVVKGITDVLAAVKNPAPVQNAPAPGLDWKSMAIGAAAIVGVGLIAKKFIFKGRK